MAITPNLRDGESFVAGRSTKTAHELITLAEKSDRVSEVLTVSHGYIVPTDLLEGGNFDAITNADQPAVITEPGTTPNREEAYNVGQAPTFDTFTEQEAGGDGDEFDPSKASVAEVNLYLADADEAERERVLTAEEAGKKRKGILEANAESTEGDK